MGAKEIFKFAGKVAGSAVLVVAGGVAGVMNQAVAMSGKDSVSSPFATLQDKSFDAVKRMWNPDQYERDIESGDYDRTVRDRRLTTLLQAEDQMKRLASAAKEAGNMEKYEEYMERYENLKEQFREAQRNL